ANGEKTTAVTAAGDAAAALRLTGGSEDNSVSQRRSSDHGIPGPEKNSEGGQSGHSATPEILVKGSRILNTDIPRTRDDAQPYVIFDRETIERSGAQNLEDFFKQHLPMNTTALTSAQLPSTNGVNTAVNLRGLGENQTLILVDGHR